MYCSKCGEKVNRRDINLLYEDNQMKIYLNSSDEVFVENKNTSHCLRIGINPQDMVITAGHVRAANFPQLIPWAINGLSAIKVK